MSDKCKCTPIELCDECYDELERTDVEPEDYCICKDDYNNPNCEWCF